MSDAKILLATRPRSRPAGTEHRIGSSVKTTSSPNASLASTLSTRSYASDALLGMKERTPRDRILQATIEIVAERGFRGTSVRLVSQRARVSNRTFYQLFGRLEDCFIAVMDEVAECTTKLIYRAFASESYWIAGVRSALASLLVLFDSEPRRARVWHLETLVVGTWALERRAYHMETLRLVAIRHWADPYQTQALDLASEGVIAAVGGILHTRLLSNYDTPLLEILGPLMGLIVAPFVDADSRTREIQRGDELARTILEGREGSAPYMAAAHVLDQQSLPNTNAESSEMLGCRGARRSCECLLAVAAHPGASNSAIATQIGVSHESQISRLLAILAKEKLIEKHSLGRGLRNEWNLTSVGEEIARELLAVEPTTIDVERR